MLIFISADHMTELLTTTVATDLNETAANLSIRSHPNPADNN
jgi:hypothetical protein